VSRAKKYGGPGCSKKELTQIQELSKDKNCPQFDRIIQKNDPVPNVDWIPIAQNVNHYIVISEKERTGFWAHADIYSTHEVSGYYLDEPTEEDQYKWERYKMTFIKNVSSFIFFPILITLHLIFAVALVGFFRFFQKSNHQ
ncbi:MAG: hypothetical protein Q8K60_08925, partial [Parachlamydiaceae bacterium]|nr:hypothetical protein [Parachlamydiaceae bacterium]